MRKYILPNPYPTADPTITIDHSTKETSKVNDRDIHSRPFTPKNDSIAFGIGFGTTPDIHITHDSLPAKSKLPVIITNASPVKPRRSSSTLGNFTSIIFTN